MATGKIYGDMNAGTARRLTQPIATHPGDHLSREAVADAADWFALTLKGGTPRPRGDQIWWGKEIGTGLALLGLAALALGLFDALLGLAPFAKLSTPPVLVSRPRDGRWWTLWLLIAFVPAVTYYLLPLSLALFKPSAVFPQAITNSLMIWAIVNALLGLLFERLLAPRRAEPDVRWGLSLVMAVIVVAVLYTVVALAGLVQVDFRFWVVALKPLSPRQALATLSYGLPFTFFVVVAFRGLGELSASPSRRQYGWAAGAPGRRVHRADRRAVPRPVLHRRPASAVRGAERHRRDPVRAAASGAGRLRRLHLASNGELCAGRANLQPVRHLVHGRGHRHPFRLAAPHKPCGHRRRIALLCPFAIVGNEPMTSVSTPANQSPRPFFSDRYKRLILALLVSAYTLNFIDRTIIATIGQAIKVDLKITDAQLGLLGGLYFALLYTLLGIPLARAAERFSRVNIITGAVVIWSGFTALCGTAASFLTLSAFRFGVGVGEAGLGPPAHSLISDYFEPKRRASALAVYSFGIPFGTMLGAVLAAGWRRTSPGVSPS